MHTIIALHVVSLPFTPFQKKLLKGCAMDHKISFIFMEWVSYILSVAKKG
jgi:hypothetical protein